MTYYDWLATYWKPSLGDPSQRVKHPQRGRTHGTVSTYRWELEQGVPPCADCKLAARVHRARFARNAAGTGRYPVPSGPT